CIIYPAKGVGSERSALRSDSMVPVDSSIVTQTFICDEDRISGITIRFAQNHTSAYGDPVEVTLTGMGRRASWLVDAPMASAGQVDLFINDPFEDTEGETFVLTAGCGGVSGLFLSTTREQHYDAQAFTLNGEEVPGGYASFQVIANRVDINLLFAVWAAAFVLIMLLLSLLLKHNVKTHNIFLFLWISISLLSLVSAVPMNTPDECPHFLRAFEISRGDLSPVMTTDSEGNKGRLLPSAVDEFYRAFRNVNEPRFSDLKRVSDIRVNEGSTKLYPAYYTPLYFPTDYAPQALGIAIMSLFTDRVLLLWYASRIMNTIWAGILLTLSIRLMPCKKELFAVLALMPVFLQETWGSAPDAGATACCMLFVAEILWLREGADPEWVRSHRKLIMLMLFATMALVSLSKIIYVPICLLFIFVPKEFYSYSEKDGKKPVFTDRWRQAIWIALAAAMAVILGVTDLFYASGYDIQLVDGVNPSLQEAYMLAHPLHFLDAMLEAFRSMTIQIVTGFFDVKGGAAVQLKTPVFTASLTLAALLSALSLRDRISVNKRIRITFIFLFILVTLLLNAAEYAAWTPYRAISVYGLQSRYYLPVLPMLLMAITPKETDSPSLRRGFPLYAVAAGDVLLLLSFMVQVL
ncbi:MAG: DUF2142 domain-containing protein, partial [Lachnospiraceae bacterium]|nr:DUF2142 domain-containing protein [Lachnospiraceae bacterium]